MKREIVKYQSDKHGTFSSVALINVDDFKRINQNMGYYFGDLVVMEMVRRLKSQIRKEDSFFHLSGDEFVVAVRNEWEEKELLGYITQLKRELESPFFVNSQKVNVTVSIGLFSAANHSLETDELLKVSNAAMLSAKEKGKNRICVFREEHRERIIKDITLRRMLELALERKEMHLVFQPQVNAKKEEIRGFEVLLRWTSKEFGVISPVEFIPMAEESRQIIPLGYWVLEQSFREFQKFMKSKKKCYVLSVNISVIQLMESDFIPNLMEIIERTGFQPECLELEITESVFMKSMRRAIIILSEIKKYGIRIALDDFGTGYSSLKYLQMLPVDTLKIDKSFIDRIGNKNENIVSTIVAMGHSMGMTVIAEGVETPQQMKYLKEENCDCFQGYLLGKPKRELQ